MTTQLAEFVEAVRASRVAHPTQRRFKLDGWERALAAVPSQSERNLRLAEAGRWVFEGLEGVRRNLVELPVAGRPRAELIRLSVALINYACAHARQEAARLLETNGGDPDPTIDANVEGLLENTIAGGRYTLAEMMQASGTDGSGGRPAPELIPGLIRRLDLGMVYDQLEDMWGHCLWGGWGVHRSQDVVLCAPMDWEDERDRMIGIARRDALLRELMIYAVTRWAGEPAWLRKIVLSPRRIVGISRGGKHKRFQLGSPALDAPEIPHEEVVRVLAEQIYLAGILQEPLPALAGLTARQLLAAWTAVAPLGRLVRERYPVGALNGTKGQLDQFAPLFDRSEIVRAVRDCGEITPEQAETIVTFWTFSGNPRDELWMQPFVEVEPGRLAIVDAALVDLNLLRSIEHWLREGEIDLQARGPVWEKYVRGELRAECSLPNTDVLDRSIDMPPSIGDIDLVIRVGRTLVIGESKCTLFPASAREEHNYRSVLQEAAEQAEVKANEVRMDPVGFVTRCGWPADVQEEWVVLPVVVTNVPSGAGQVVDGVPVLDMPLLVRFLGEGVWHRMNEVSSDGQITPVDTVRLYDSPAEAETALPGYLLNPPQVAHYRANVQRGIRPVIQVIQGPTICIETAEVRLPAWSGVAEGVAGR